MLHLRSPDTRLCTGLVRIPWLSCRLNFRYSIQNRINMYVFGANAICNAQYDFPNTITFMQIILSISIIYNSHGLDPTPQGAQFTGRTFYEVSWYRVWTCAFGRNVAFIIVEIRQAVQTILTLIHVVYNNVDSVLPVCIQFIINDRLDFLASLHLVLFWLLFFLEHGWDSTINRFVFFLPSLFGEGDCSSVGMYDNVWKADPVPN